MRKSCSDLTVWCARRGRRLAMAGLPVAQSQVDEALEFLAVAVARGSSASKWIQERGAGTRRRTGIDVTWQSQTWS